MDADAGSVPRINHSDRSEPSAEKGCTQASMIGQVKKLYGELGAIGRAEALVRSYTQSALDAVTILPDSETRGLLYWYANMLLQRTH